MRSVFTAIALAGLSLVAAGCTVNNPGPDRPTTVVTQPAPAAVVTQPAPVVVPAPTTTYITPPRTTVVTPAY